jgi:hypothetical protein
MSNVQSLVDRYIAAWNETDRKRRRDLIAETYSEGARYLDPALSAEGLEAIDGMVAAVHERFPGHLFRQTGDVDAHNDRIRFTWELGPKGGPAIVKGIDFGVVEAGRLREVTGFFTERAGG